MNAKLVESTSLPLIVGQELTRLDGVTDITDGYVVGGREMILYTRSGNWYRANDGEQMTRVRGIFVEACYARQFQNELSAATACVRQDSILNPVAKRVEILERALVSANSVLESLERGFFPTARKIKDQGYGGALKDDVLRALELKDELQQLLP